MKPLRLLAPFALFGAAVACGNVPDDPGARIFPAAGVITGTVLYQGPHPCSENGHIIGNAILLIFDRRNPPPPNGLAVLPANFADVTGDALFQNEPRYTGSDKPYCPVDHGFTDTITVAAPFAVSPLGTPQPDGSIQGASYEIEAFFDYTGDFLPTFKVRELPEMGDIGGGDIDTANALEPINQGNPNYQAHFLPVNVGNPEPLQAGQTIPTYDIPSSGFVTSNVVVTLGQALTLTRPYFYAQGLGLGPNGTTIQSSDGTKLNYGAVQSSDCPLGAKNANGPNGAGSGPPCAVAGSSASTIPGTAETDPGGNYQPILTIPQDISALSAPDPTDIANSQQNTNLFESVLPHINLVYGAPAPQELSLSQTTPFDFQLGGSFPTKFSVFQNEYFEPSTQTWMPLTIPEGLVPMLWPEVILSKLIDDDTLSDGVTPDPAHTNDPASLTAQGSAGNPVVIMQGITLLNAQQTGPFGPGQPDTLFNTVLGGGTDAILGGAYNGTLIDSTGRPVVNPQDHLTVALRPVVICFSDLFDNPPAADPRGTLVTPLSGAPTASFTAGNSAPRGPVVPADILSNGDLDHRFQVTNLVKNIQYGCLPKGRYAINIVYPDGQAWTVPNEAGACSGSEGSSDFNDITCTIKPRPLLYSQGNRAVVEVVGPSNPANCKGANPDPSTKIDPNTIPAGNPAPQVPAVCLPVPPSQ